MLKFGIGGLRYILRLAASLLGGCRCAKGSVTSVNEQCVFGVTFRGCGCPIRTLASGYRGANPSNLSSLCAVTGNPHNSQVLRLHAQMTYH
jgi:hypothetical protein